jgi:hypothetical protein
MWRSSAFGGLPLATVAWSATLLAGRAAFVFFVADVFLAVAFDFLFVFFIEVS